MGLVNRVVESGKALDAAVELGESIAAFPSCACGVIAVGNRSVEPGRRRDAP